MFGGGDGYIPPSGPGRSGPGPPSLDIPLECRLWAKQARFHDISHKVSKNLEVSPKSVEKACHSPHLQNGLQKSPLDILRIPYSPAFSHKELMGRFLTVPSTLWSKRRSVARCAPLYSTDVTRNGRQIPPLPTTASCPLSAAPHLARRGILNGSVLASFTGDYD